MSEHFESPSNNERAARAGFAQRRVVWFGGAEDWVKDWLFYLENEHTLMSMWRGHALHPFQRFDRVMYFLCVLCFSLFMSAYVQSAHPMGAGATEYIGWLVLASILLMVYDYALRFFATSPCVQPGGSCYDTCWLCHDCCVDCGRQGLYACAGGSSGFLVAGVVLASTSDSVAPGTFFATWFLMRLLSYVAEIAVHAYYFYALREHQRQHWLDGVAGGAYPLGPQFPDRLFVIETRNDGDLHRWPDAQDNPLRGGVKPVDPNLRRADQDRRQRQIEMLRHARDQVGAREASPDPLDDLGLRAV